ncbi:UDP-4-amino-4,6-dideoxy-N-acetyl-beta-L-altrosamine transaminase [Chitiniphilus eburneus]|uniref:UDP-4-amino-4, 6-dideoxy-N-acetyl-beta-L-altrosamine transaminase n=1 Tax=Chitiniphilus eburneus TaxID=2571148 RepID=A0A4V5MRR1_9NEIS|nr:UDP-4-amino-4,6-dideoxy-N-acetyl-beta-L-altrosamine transaminase [Chitiniphilus eburneus]TJZ77298.1 UDP-4-amino-4,6-dideoxy-N-acetyl-beta-L-altrosamine transaminase [Chitiniphilus eburneus]
MAIPYGRQWLDEEDERAVLDTLRSDYLTQGPKIAEFERALCDYTGARYCVVAASGTAALHLAVAALELPPGSEGITSANTFTASANSMAYCGVKPVFADIDPVSYNIDPASIAMRITPATRLLTPVHFAGQPAEMEAISTLARERGLKVIEDAAHAIGSRYRDGGLVGNCRYADATVFSFHPVKTLTTGEGGAVMTNDEALYRRMVLLRTHGITKEPALLTQNPGPWYYEMHALGWHYRMTDMQAALGVSQLKKLDRFAARRREIVARYNALLADLPWLRTPVEADGVASCFHLYVPRIDFAALGKTRVQVMRELLDLGVGTQVHYIPVHTQPWYRETYGYGPGDCPVAEAYYEQCLSLPLYAALTDEEVATVVAAVRSLA